MGLLLKESFLMVLLHLVTRSSPILCNPMDCRSPDSSVHGDSPGKDIGVSCHPLLQGIFPIQGSNPGLPHCRWILYCLSHQGSPFDSHDSQNTIALNIKDEKYPVPISSNAVVELCFSLNGLMAS